MKKKIKIKKIVIFIIITIVLIFLLSNVLDKNNSKLEKIGYNNNEIKEIKKLSKKELSIIYKYIYNDKLINIIQDKNYDSKNLNLYLKYSSKYKEIDYSKIIELVNNKNFKKQNIDKYIKYLNKYSSINDTTLSFINQKYFINDYIDRYLNYYSSNKDLSFNEIVTRVNSNLDYNFYTDSKKADLTKKMYTLVNKFYYLDKNFIPDDLVDVESTYARDSAKLVKIAYENFVKMANDMKKLGMIVKVTTGYRSYNFQATLYNNYVKSDGVKKADTYSARPGYSEHQLGYSADLMNGKGASFGEFENTEEFNWLKDNAHKYGFILRYPKDKEYLTGYVYESWHYRYVGIDVATYIYENNITYEEYYAYFLR